MRIGVVIPTLDEEALIGRTLRALGRRGEAAVVVVADCGSRDRTVAIAARTGAVVTGGGHLTGRAAALEAGVEAALGRRPDLEALLFLHADCIPAHGWDRAIAEALDDRGAVGGAFDFRWDLRGVAAASRVGLLAISAYNRLRIRATRVYFGDQGIFVRPSVLAAIGGVPRVALLEDCILCRRLRKVGRLRLARGRMVTSPRRFLRHGIIRQAMIDAVILAAHRLGLEPTRLHAWYNREKA